MHQARSNNAVARYLVVQSAVGAIVSIVMAALMLATDVAGIRSLIVSSSEPWLVVLVFAGVLFAIWPLVFATGVELLSGSDSSS